MKRLLMWMLVVMVALAGCQPVAPQPEQGGGEAGLYADPEGNFSVPLPAKWQVARAEGYTQLSTPNGLLKLYLLFLEGVALEEAVAEAWTIVDPTFILAPSLVEEAPSRPGVSRSLYHDYAAGDGQMALAIAEEVGTRVYVTLVRGDAGEVAKRSSQINVILSGLTLAGIEEVDLAGVSPRLLTPALLDELRAYIADAMVRFDVPGAAVAIVQGDEVILLEGFGVRERGSDLPVTPKSRMMIGSITKTMTTMLMAQLVDEGLVQWETPVQAILPEFAVADPTISAEMTLQNLVCACSGVPRRDLEFFFHANEMTAQKVIASLQSFEFFTPFGEAFQYSNQLVATGGWVAAAATGAAIEALDEAYVRLMEERIFGPIGMGDTTFSFDEVVTSEDAARPHSLSLTGARTPLPVDADRLLVGIAPAGAAWSNAQDMSRYLLTLMDRGVTPEGVQVASSANLAETWQPQVAVDGASSYGLGWFVDSYLGQPLLHHGGATSGFTSELAFLPEAGLGLVVLSNGRLTNAFTQAVRFRLFELAFEQPHDFDAMASFQHEQTVKLSLAPVAEARPVTPEVVAPFVGRYVNDALGELVVRLEEGRLVLDSGELVMEALAVDEGATVMHYVINSYIGPVLGIYVYFGHDETGAPKVTLMKGMDAYEFGWVR